MTVDHKTLSEGHEMSVIHCQGALIEIEVDFHQVCGKTVEVVGLFHPIGRLCKYSSIFALD